jgi:hypothetical protein
MLCAGGTTDPDLWGHLRFGLDLLQTGRLPTVDPYSFTQDVPWINHEWLSEAIFAAAFRTAGVFGLLIVKGLALATAAWLLAAVARRADQRLRWWLLAISLVGLTPAAVTFRPQLWTILALAFLCRTLSVGRSLKWIPVVFAVWANLHGGWIVGVGLSGLWVAGRAIDTRSLRAVLPAALASAAGIVATLINPYGWRLWMFLMSTVRLNRNITEWRPLWEQPDLSHGALWAAMVLVLTTTAVMRWRSLTWATVLPVVWLGASSLLVDRLSPLFCEVALLATAQAWRRLTPHNLLGVMVRRPRGALLIDALAVTIVWTLNAIAPARCLAVAYEGSPDLVAASALGSPTVRGRLVLPFDWGEYAIWHWGPRLRVSIDGRRETVYTEATVGLQAAIVAARSEGIDYINRVRPEYVWLPKPSAVRTAEWLTVHGYRMDAETSQSFIAARADLPPLVPGPPMPACFP